MEYARLDELGANAVVEALAGRAKGIAVATSGSTGLPRQVLLSTGALCHSAQSSLDALGDPGNWLLALPTNRIAGAMVLVRAAVGDSQVVPMARGPFTPAAFAEATAKLGREAPRYTALVPTQVTRLLADAQGTEALASFDAVLVGGAALREQHPPANIVRTYGMTETAGGCVYNGMPIGDTAIRVRQDGRILIATSSLADDYSPAEPDAWEVNGGRRWLITSDVGEVREGRLTVMGRADDVITTGGVKVHPRSVEDAILALDWVAEAAVVGRADAEWGSIVVAFVVAREGSQPQRLWDLRESLNDVLPRAALPKELAALSALPTLASGKIDYPTLRSLARGIERNAQ